MLIYHRVIYIYIPTTLRIFTDIYPNYFVKATFLGNHGGITGIVVASPLGNVDKKLWKLTMVSTGKSTS